MPLSDPQARRAFRRELERLWLLGHSLVLGWRLLDGRVALLLLPQARLPEIDAAVPFLLEGESRRLAEDDFEAAATRFNLDVVLIEEPEFHDLDAATVATIDDAVRHYSVWHTPRRAAALLDIVAFSRSGRIDQVMLLNGLASSIAIAERRFTQLGLGVDLGRSSTGDGFYLWNRRTGRESEAELLALLVLALADNRFAGVGADSPAPRLRVAFTAGGHFTFHEPDDREPRPRDYIVGEATIALARLVAGAAPRQILVGAAAGPVHGPDGLLAATQARLDRLAGVPLLEGRVESLTLRLEGGARPRRVVVRDKHGMAHAAWNARVDLLRDDGACFSLGIREGAPAGAGPGYSATVSPPST
jgi:hypothetical protein